MPKPGRSILFITVVLALVLLAAPIAPMLAAAALFIDLCLIALVFIRGHQLKRAAPVIEPDIENSAAWTRLETEHEALLVWTVRSTSRHPIRVRISQPLPPGFEGGTTSNHTGTTTSSSPDEPKAEAETRLEPRETVRLGIKVTPYRRGRFVVPPAEIRLTDSMAIAHIDYRLSISPPLTVFPNLRQVAQHETLRRNHALQRSGIHRRRMIGAGREFDRLRDYVPDDDFRAINWKATARRRQPITTVYQSERGQDVMIAIDCGRMMGSITGHGRTALDHAVDAAVMLAHVSERSQDRTGLILFRDTVTRYIKPTGRSAPLIESLVAAKSAPVFPSYTELASSVRANQSRRGMLFLFTDLNDPQLASNLVEAMPMLSRRHVVVVVSLDDPMLRGIADGTPTQKSGLYQVLAARSLADERETRLRTLAKAGVQTLEVDADKITTEVINRYLEIKVRQQV